MHDTRFCSLNVGRVVRIVTASGALRYLSDKQTEAKLAPRHFNILVAVALTLPVTTFAQNPYGPLTRAQVLRHLYELEDLGYRPGQASSLRFPYDIEAAEERLAEKKREQVSHPDISIRSDSRANPEGVP